MEWDKVKESMRGGRAKNAIESHRLGARLALARQPKLPRISRDTCAASESWVKCTQETGQCKHLYAAARLLNVQVSNGAPH